MVVQAVWALGRLTSKLANKCCSAQQKVETAVWEVGGRRRSAAVKTTSQSVGRSPVQFTSRPIIPHCDNMSLLLLIFGTQLRLSKTRLDATRSPPAYSNLQGTHTVGGHSPRDTGRRRGEVGGAGRARLFRDSWGLVRS